MKKLVFAAALVTLVAVGCKESTKEAEEVSMDIETVVEQAEDPVVVKIDSINSDIKKSSEEINQLLEEL